MSDEVQMVPVNAWFKGDHITHLVVFESTDTIRRRSRRSPT